MSEIMCPISDYRNAIDIIRKNDSLCEGLNLYYIAAYLCSEWLFGKNDFLEKLEDMIDAVEESDKSIIYYLKAHDISCSVKNWRENEDYRFYLLKSIECSKDMNFVNNRCDLAKILGSKEVLVYLKEAAVNVYYIISRQKNQYSLKLLITGYPANVLLMSLFWLRIYLKMLMIINWGKQICDLMVKQSFRVSPKKYLPFRKCWRILGYE